MLPTVFPEVGITTLTRRRVLMMSFHVGYLYYVD